MVAIKILCPCGQHFVFDVEPVDGQMPCSVACPSCGLDATASVNKQLQAQASQAKAATPEPADKTKLIVVGLIVAIVAVVAAGATAFFYLQRQPAATPVTQATQSVDEPSAQSPLAPQTLSASTNVAPVVAAAPQETPTANEPAEQTEASTPAPEEPTLSAAPEKATRPAKPPRDPSLVAVGALFNDDAEHRVVVTTVVPGSPADEAGIVRGMIIKKVNGKPVKGVPLPALADKFYGPVGTKLTLELVKPQTGETMKVKLTRRVYKK